jgi:colanic acid/amylovoran biosynthesis glycosyltransferase
VEHGCPAEKIKILPVGLISSSYPYACREDDGKRPVRLLTVGRLVEKKGHRYVIEALSLLKGKGRSLSYVIAGDGPLRGELENLVDSFGLRESVSFTGLVHNEEVADLYREADVFILTSVTSQDGDMEGQGLVLQEAQSTGLPVISTLHNGIPDGVLDGVSGFLVPEKDAAAAARRLAELSGDAGLRFRMGKAGSDFVRINYDIGALTKRTLTYYSDIIEKSSGG